MNAPIYVLYTEYIEYGDDRQLIVTIQTVTPDLEKVSLAIKNLKKVGDDDCAYLQEWVDGVLINETEIKF